MHKTFKNTNEMLKFLDNIKRDFEDSEEDKGTLL